MEISFNRFKTFKLSDSITSDNPPSSPGDINNPYSLTDWITRISGVLGEPESYIKVYNEYLRSWYTKNGNSARDAQNQISTAYKNLLKEILLKYTTESEKRFLSNLDYNDPNDLEVALPFYVKRLKEIILYFKDKRSEIPFQKYKNDLIGSVNGLETILYNEVLRLIQSEKYTSLFSDLPDIATLSIDLIIKVQELYDTAQEYYNHSNTANDILPIVDLQKATQQLLQDNPNLITSAGIALVSQGTLITTGQVVDNEAVKGLPHSNFYDYDRNISKLNLTLYQSLYQNYIGSPLIYLSSGGGSSNYLIGALVSPTNKYLNLLNVTNPCINFSSTSTSTYSIKQIGGFFTPQKTGVLKYENINYVPVINTSKITSEMLCAYPDPNVIGSQAFTYIENYAQLQGDASNQQLAGDIVQSSNIQKFYPYQSKGETNKLWQIGISRTTDNVDFWKGDNKNIWANSDVYPEIEPNEFDLPTRIEDLRIDQKDVTHWCSDIFGNEYAVYKTIQPVKGVTERLLLQSISQAASIQYCTIYDGIYLRHPRTWETPTYPLTSTGTDLIGNTDFDSYLLGGVLLPYDCTAEPPDWFCSIKDGYYFIFPIVGNPYSRTVNPSSAYDNNTPSFSAQNPDLYPLSAFETGQLQLSTFAFDELWDGGYLIPNPCDEINDLSVNSQDNSYSSFEILSNSVSGAQTEFDVISETLSAELSIYNKKFKTTGNVWFRNLYSSQISQIQAVFTAIEDNPEIYNNIVNFDVFYDIAAFQTRNIVLFDKIEFNYSTGKIKPSTSNNLSISSTDADLEKIIQPFFNEKDNKIITGKVTVSGGVVYPELHSYDLQDNTLLNVFPTNKDTDEKLFFQLPPELQGFIYSSIDYPILSYNTDYEKYICTYRATLSSTTTDYLFCIIHASFKFDGPVIKVRDVNIYHSDLSNVPQRASFGTNSFTQVTQTGTSTYTLPNINSYNPTITIVPSGIYVQPSSGIKVRSIAYDFGDGTKRTVSRSLFLNTITNSIPDLATYPDKTDLNDPRGTVVSHQYTFGTPVSSVVITMTASFYDTLGTTEVFTISAPVEEYNLTTGFSNVHIINTKSYAAPNGEHLVLTLETQQPRFVTDVVINNNDVNNIKY